MCGLVGALAYGEFLEKRLEKIRQESMIFLTLIGNWSRLRVAE